MLILKEDACTIYPQVSKIYADDLKKQCFSDITGQQNAHVIIMCHVISPICSVYSFMAVSPQTWASCFLSKPGSPSESPVSGTTELDQSCAQNAWI